jgi:glycosyltransferase involved in cell wall biosynthesis
MERWWLASGVPPGRLRLIPSGVDLALFRRQPVDRAGFGFDPGRFNVVFLGRLSREKGPLDLLAAMRRLAGRAITLHLYGAGPLLPAIKRYIATHQLQDAVRLHGVVPRAALPALYSAADLIVLPSHTEALPRVMAEAMACGCAFLGARISGMEDHIVDGQTGFLVPPHAPTCLAQRIADAAGDRGALARVAQQGQAYAADTLAWPAVMRRVIAEVYERGPHQEAIP